MDMTKPPPSGERYLAVHQSAEFSALRRRWQRFVLQATLASGGWWMLAIVLGAFAPGFYRTKIAGEFNVGALFILGSFAVVIAVAAVYLRFARTELDPVADRVRAELEGSTR